MSQERKPERVRDEKINGVIYDMSPAPAYQHSQVIGQIFAKIKNGLKGSMCLVFMETKRGDQDPWIWSHMWL